MPPSPHVPLFFSFKLLGTNGLFNQTTSSDTPFKEYWKTFHIGKKLKHQPYVGKVLFYLNWETDRKKTWKPTINDRPALLPFTFRNHLLGTVMHFQIWLRIGCIMMLASPRVSSSTSEGPCLLSPVVTTGEGSPRCSDQRTRVPAPTVLQPFVFSFSKTQRTLLLGFYSPSSSPLTGSSRGSPSVPVQVRNQNTQLTAQY